MGAGKDALAAEIVRQHPQYRVEKFAAALRRAAGALLGVDPSKTETAADKAADLSARRWAPAEFDRRVALAIEAAGLAPTAGMVAAIRGRVAADRPDGTVALALGASCTVGRLLQVLGTEGFRGAAGEDVWADAAMAGWARAGRPPWVLADARFPNETAAVRRAGGVVVLVRRPGAGREDGRAAAHASETALDGEAPDVAVDNDGPLSALGAALARAWPGIRRAAAARADA